jgi:DNA-binding beta-propeller fold protein YncE
MVLENLVVTTIAGCGLAGHLDGPALQAQLDRPYGVVVTPNGDIYFSDFGDHRIKVIQNGQVRTVAGDGTAGRSNGPALSSRLNLPFGIALGLDGAILIADYGNGRIRKLQNGRLRTLQSNLSHPSDVAIDSNGHIYVSESSAPRIVELNNGQVRVVAGSGIAGSADGPALQAQLNRPWGLAFGPDGSLYVSDCGAHCIKVLKNGELRTIAGGSGAGFADGPALQAKLSDPRHIFCGRNGDLYIADQGNHRIRVLRKGFLRTIAGNGTGSFADGPALQSCFNYPSGIALHPDGALIVTDNSNHRLRKIPNVDASLHLRTSSPLCLTKSIDKYTNMEIESASASIKVHKSFVEARFPAIREAIPSIRSANLDIRALEAFREYIYSDTLPEDLQPKTYLGLAVRIRTTIHCRRTIYLLISFSFSVLKVSLEQMQLCWFGVRLFDSAQQDNNRPADRRYSREFNHTIL